MTDRISHRAAVEAGYADLKGYIEKWGNDVQKEHFEVQHYTLVDGWVNCWTTIEANGDESPTTYETYKAAIFDLDDMFDEQDYEVTLRIMEPEHRHSDDEYRIVRFINGVVTDIVPYVWLRKAEDK